MDINLFFFVFRKSYLDLLNFCADTYFVLPFGLIDSKLFLLQCSPFKLGKCPKKSEQIKLSQIKLSLVEYSAIEYLIFKKFQKTIITVN